MRPNAGVRDLTDMDLLRNAARGGSVSCVPASWASGPFDMQLVYEDMPQESGSYLYRAAHISTTGWANGNRYGDEYGCEYGRQVCIYTAFCPREDQSINQVKEASKVIWELYSGVSDNLGNVKITPVRVILYAELTLLVGL